LRRSIVPAFHLVIFQSENPQRAKAMSILILLAQCVTIFLASVLAGSLPLMFKSALSGESLRPSLQQYSCSRFDLGKRLKIISVFGMGLLVGAALTIIIPEYAFHT